MSENTTRRFFLGAASAASAMRVWGANERINVAIVGLGGRGSNHLSIYSKLTEARVVGLCDVNQAARERAQATLVKNTSEKAKEFEDMREAFADPNVEAVSIATPNHWHALAAIWAMKAGKDVYGEKPACYNIYEGQKMIQVMRDTKRVMQVGSQHRSTPFKMKAMKAIHEGLIDMAVLDHTIRDEFNRTAERRLVVLHPLKVVLTNYPEGKVEDLEAVNNPEDETAGKRKVPFSRELFIDAADFMETPPPKYFRLKPGGEVRLKYAYIIKCNEVVKDSSGNVTELRCTIDLESKSGGVTSNRKVKGTIHWVSAAHARDAEIRLYDRLFTAPEPDATGDFKSFINPHSLEVANAKCEPALAEATRKKRYQFERLGYFTLDPDSHRDQTSVEPDGDVKGYLGEGNEEGVTFPRVSS